MKAKEPSPLFPVPLTTGRTESDLTEHGTQRELDGFRATLPPSARVQVYTMMALTDPKHMDRPQQARVADIARAMGFQPNPISGQLSGHVFQDIEETGMDLRQKAYNLFIREPAGFTADHRRKWKPMIVNLSLLQEFGFYYEDGEGQPINLDERPKEELIEYPADGGRSTLAIPMLDGQGRIKRKKDGSPWRRRANGVTWRWASRFAEWAKDPLTSWIIHLEAVQILRQYLEHNNKAAFRLAEMTLFWKRLQKDKQIEASEDTLIRHLGLKGKDRALVAASIVNAFDAIFRDGIIDKPVQIKPKGFYPKTKKTGQRRRSGIVYQWRIAARWRIGKTIDGDQVEGHKDDKTEKPKA